MIAIYARISKDRQDGAGVERQLKECHRLIEGGRDVIEYVDNDLSAYDRKKKRPKYDELLADARSGQVDYVVVYHLDRLYRQPRQLEDWVDLADAGRVKVKAATGDFDLSTDAGIMVARMLVAAANNESRNTSRRVKAQKKQAKEQGRLLGGPRAFGWRTEPVKDKRGVPVMKSNGKVQTQLVPVPDEVKAIRDAVDRLLKGQSLNNIATLWNERQVPTPQGKRDRKRNPEGANEHQGRWTPQTVKNVMSNRRHAGPVIDAKKFDQLQALLTRRAGVRVPRRRSLLTGLVRCSLCGHTMVRSGASDQRTLRCSKPLGGCGRISINYAGVEALLVESTLLRADRGALARIMRSMGKGGEQDRIMRDLEALTAQEDDLSASFAAKRLPISAFEKAMAAIEGERRGLQSKLSRLASTSVIAPYAGKPGALRAAWPTMTQDQQREVIKTVLGKVEVTPTRKRGMPTFDQDRVQIAK